MLRIIALQYNPDTLTRSLQVQGVGGEGGDCSEALRLKDPPVETIKLEAEIDAADQLEFPEQNENIVKSGLHTQLVALETIVYPTSFISLIKDVLVGINAFIQSVNAVSGL